jgi:transposase
MHHVGVGVAKGAHAIGAVDERGKAVRKPMPSKNPGDGFGRRMCRLGGLAEGPDDALVAMEATGHHRVALSSHLVAAGHAVCAINPMQAKAVRKLKGMERVRDDRVDSGLIAETLRIGQREPSAPADERVRSLRVLTRHHQSTRGDAAEARTQPTCILDAHLPEHGGPLSDPMCASSLAPLGLAPLPADLVRREATAVSRALSEAPGGRLGEGKATGVMEAARTPVGHRVGPEAASTRARSLVRAIGFLQGEADKVAARVGAPLRDIGPLVLTIPGVGEATGAQIAAGTGDIPRLASAKAPARCAGLDSSVSQPGESGSGGGPIPRGGDPCPRRSIWLAASRAWRCDTKPRESYGKKRAEGKPRRVAVTAVARKPCHIVFAVMRDKKEHGPGRWSCGASSPQAFDIRLSRCLACSGALVFAYLKAVLESPLENA